MKATDIVRSVLDVIDHLEAQEEQPTEVEAASPCAAEPSRFKQIFSLLNDPNRGYDNSPDEHVAPVSAVTVHAGGGVNGPKHSADIRVKDPGAYNGS